MPSLAWAQKITLKESVNVKGVYFFCSDIADIEGNPPWQQTRLGKTPAPGITVNFDRATLERKLEEAGVAVEALDWLGAESVEIATDAIVVSSEEQSAKGREFLAQNLTWPAADMSYDLDADPPRALTLPAPRQTLEIAPRFPAVPRHKGRVVIELGIAIDGQPLRTVSLTFQVRVWQTVLMTKNFVPRNTTLAAVHVCQRRLEITNLANAPLPAAGNYATWQTRRNLNPGQVLTFQDVEESPDIRRGALVTVVFETTGLRVTSPAKSLDQGKVGEVIRALNLSTNRIIKGRVVDASTIALVTGE
jgi:flagella basal body P-ring formation protein FlgA